MSLPELPPGLPAWAIVFIFIVIVLGLIALAYFTGNHKKKSVTYKNISQNGNNNNQNFGSSTDKIKEDS